MKAWLPLRALAAAAAFPAAVTSLSAGYGVGGLSLSRRATTTARPMLWWGGRVGTIRASSALASTSQSDNGSSSSKKNFSDQKINSDINRRRRSVSSSSLTLRRRQVLTLATTVVTSALLNPPAAHAIRAVGGSELECRAAGNCLEVGEWDGAIGWTWGAAERCDAVSDPTCGAGGKTLAVNADGTLQGQPVPDVGDATRLTHIAVVRIDIGRDETGVLRLGLYGNEAPASIVAQLVDFLSPDGLVATKPGSSNAALGTMTAPVSLGTGGVVSWVTPGVSVELGVPSQAYAYARSRGLRTVADSFVPQPRPMVPPTDNVPLASLHNAAGLLSIPKKGLGYGGSGFESDDECYERAILITNNSANASSLDKNRRVVGQVLDGASMAFLERLANLPTKRGIRGVVSNDGPPLPKVIVRDVQVATVVNKPGTQ